MKKKIAKIESYTFGSSPDIDVDFEDQRRLEVLQHVTDLYGKDCVCNILILNYLKTKSAFKDVARTFELPFGYSNKISSYIHENTEMDFRTAYSFALAVVQNKEFIRKTLNEGSENDEHFY